MFFKIITARNVLKRCTCIHTLAHRHAHRSNQADITTVVQGNAVNMCQWHGISWATSISLMFSFFFSFQTYGLLIDSAVMICLHWIHMVGETTLFFIYLDLRACHVWLQGICVWIYRKCINRGWRVVTVPVIQLVTKKSWELEVENVSLKSPACIQMCLQ